MVSSAVGAGRFGSRGTPPGRGGLGRDVFGSQPTGFLTGNHLMNSHLNPHNDPSFNSIPQNSIQQTSTENPNSDMLIANQQPQNNTLTQKNDNPQNTTPSSNDGDQLSNKIKHIIFSNGRPEMPPPRWYNAVVPLGVDEDKYWLSELHTLLRKEFVEVFGTTQTDIVIPVHGRMKPITLGQVGLRCIHCKGLSSFDRPNHAITYPNHISGIYNSVQQMFRQHFDKCPGIPEELRKRIASLKDSPKSNNRGGRKQYWIDSAKRVGMVDTPWGIHFGRDPNDPLPPLGGMSVKDKSVVNYYGDEADDAGINATATADADGSPSRREKEGENESIVDVEEPEPYPLVEPSDRPLISDYLYLALEQMQPCNLMDADRVGCYKGRRLGFPGLACKHCVGQAGCGRYFPASEASISQTTTSQTIVNHVRNCRRCPIEIREQLELMKRAKAGPDYKKGDKPKHGGRKVFFHRLWCRIQRIPLPSFEKLVDQDKEEYLPDSAKKEKNSDASAKDNEHPIISIEERSQNDKSNLQLETIVEDISKAKDEEDHGTTEVAEEFDPESVSHGVEETLQEENEVIDGITRLSRDDDPHWLSDAQCFIRQELTEVFTSSEKDIEIGGAPQRGQVGIRCLYCAKNKPLEDRQSGHVYYPSSVSQIQQAVSDLQRRHFQLCSEIPDNIRETFKSLKGYGAKSEDDTSQYWIDSAVELGLCDSFEGQGVQFFRNPKNKSPAEEFELEKNDNLPTKSFIVRAEDRAECTDHLILLMQQFVPCRFQESDRRGGQNSRGRDRPIGFPGLVCAHCKKKRYFPVAAKNFSDTHNLMVTHIGNCFNVPFPIKASLIYLQHRSILQKAELPNNYKLCFFKRIWGRLHNEEWPNENEKLDSQTVVNKDSLDQSSEDDSEDFDSNGGAFVTEEVTNEEEENVAHALTDVATEETETSHDGLEEMKDLIKAAAIWLCERDAELDQRTRAGRGRGIYLMTPRAAGRGGGGRGGRGKILR